MNRSTYELLDWQALDRIAPARWLVAGHLPEGGLVTLTGASGVGKTFLALDLALSVATGTPWHGSATAQGPAVLIAAEGSNGIKSRVHGWLADHDVDDPGFFHAIDEPVNLSAPGDVDKLLRTLAGLPEPPRLVIFDTLARSMVGADENSATGMGLVVDQAGRIQRETGATVLLVHHTGHSNERERGSSALRAAVDTAIHAKGSQGGRSVDVSCSKMKDAAPFSTLVFELAASGSSLVPRLVSRTDARTDAAGDGGRNETDAARHARFRQAALEALRRADSPPSATKLGELTRGHKTHRDAAIKSLIEDGEIVRRGKKLFLPDDVPGGASRGGAEDEEHR